MPSSLTEVETELRKKLSLLKDAAKVLLFAEPCLWDPNWLRTSQEYFQQLVAPNLEQVTQDRAATLPG